MEKVSDAIGQAIDLGKEAENAVGRFSTAISDLAKIDTSFFAEKDRQDLTRLSWYAYETEMALGYLKSIHESVVWLEERENK
ncbi:MAG: hypothetical protein E6X52_01080 [Actinomyces sp.]|uniref:hypothetical protein n=1 Tax=uncultured Actinomyces sp. TaxID=249061 RepID=UPI002803AEA1|nr:hypothetical protein [uncultured Actinomyces sp.]MDU4831125.1 hypothetical protein [Actinomyces sp.]